MRGFHPRARVIFCPSRATLTQLKNAGFHDRLGIWSRGVDAVHFTPVRRNQVVRVASAPGARRILLYVGRIFDELFRQYETISSPASPARVA